MYTICISGQDQTQIIQSSHLNITISSLLLPSDSSCLLSYQNKLLRNHLLLSDYISSIDTDDELIIRLNCERFGLLGGKGGFGSLLRGQSARAGQKKTTDYGACRDLNGRRLRQVENEQQMQEWTEEQERAREEKEAELEKERQKKKEENNRLISVEVTKSRERESVIKSAINNGLKIQKQELQKQQQQDHSKVNGKQNVALGAKRKRNILSVDDEEDSDSGDEVSDKEKKQQNQCSKSNKKQRK